ncbi:MAG: transposase [Bryobacterales bacterium]|nr:transposase [Bryobacterales bacterium]
MTIPDPIVVAGIDAGKSKLDAHILKGGLERRFNNDKCGRRALCNWLLKHGVTRTVFEPTGRYHRNLHQCLFDAAIETVLVNPLCSRRFAEALGQLAKNDRVDAAMLARFGCLEGLDRPRPSRGKPSKVALVAVMRKLASLLNILLRENRLWQAEPPIRQLEAAA